MNDEHKTDIHTDLTARQEQLLQASDLTARQEQLLQASDLAGQAATHPAGGEPLRQLAPLLVDLVVQLAAEVEQLKAEARRSPCEGCGQAGEAF